VKRVFAVVLFVAGFAAAGAFSGAVIADVGTSTATTADTTTAATTTAATTTTTTTPAGLLPAGVRIAGVRVGGLARSDAASAVQHAFAAALPVVVDTTRLRLDPTSVATAYVDTAVARARASAPGSNVELVVAVNGPALHAWLAKVAGRLVQPPSDATLTLRNGRPTLTPEVVGHALSTKKLFPRIVAALRNSSRLPIRARTQTTAPTVTAKSFGPVILINRSLNRLFLFKDTGRSLQPWRTFAVATGQAIYPTPAGTWHIVVKWVNPWWYPPTQDAWAKGLMPVPPGPSNPLGTRWMGLDAPGVGIHGTDEPASIGYSASHGCIRMQVPDAEWLFTKVRIGTTVFIV
jgi:lipoprotein-anchoring transpeptidase ErfK/SrfK